MSKFIKFFARNKASSIAVIILLAFLLFSMSINLGFFADKHSQLNNLNIWLKNNEFYVVLSHIALIFAIYYGWDIRVDHHVARMDEKPSTKVISQTKRYRWLLIVAVAGISLIPHI